jgi:LacI family transcriptional regulator
LDALAGVEMPPTFSGGQGVYGLATRRGLALLGRLMRNAPPTIKEVAAAVGFSPAAVSLALRNHHSIPPATREQIWAKARQLGYRQNPLVAALMTRLRSKLPTERHTVLALVTSHPPEESWRRQRTFEEMSDGARQRAAELGYRLEEFSLRAPGMTPARFVQVLRTRNIHGLLINPLPHEEKALSLDLSQFAVVGLGPSVTSPPIERVSNDHFQSALLAIHQCQALGYRRIGLVISQEMSGRLEDRWLSAFYLAQQRMPPGQRVRPLMPEQTAEIAKALPVWRAKEKPDVILFGFFSLGYQALLPRSIGFVALSVYEVDGPLTGIYQNSRQVGTIATDHVVGRLQRSDFGPHETARLHLIAGQWAPGRTAPGPGRRRDVLEAKDLASY